MNGDWRRSMELFQATMPSQTDRVATTTDTSTNDLAYRPPTQSSTGSAADHTILQANE